MVAGIDELLSARGLGRVWLIAAACALLVCTYGVVYSQVVFDLAMSGRRDLKTYMVPVMVSRVVRLVLKVVPGAAAAGFGGHADTRMPVALRVDVDRDVVDVAGIETLIGRLKRVLSAMTADWGRRS